MKMLGLVAVLALGAGIPALAQPYAGSGAGTTRVQVQARAAEMFAALDANHDGYVTQAEVEARVGAMQGQAAEMRTRAADRRFDRLDRNKDGAITRPEFEAPRPAGRGAVAEPSQGPARAGTPAGGPGGRGMRLTARMFERSDTNKDGRLTLAEMTATQLARFDMADANKDGTVTPEERRAARGNMRGQAGERPQSDDPR